MERVKTGIPGLDDLLNGGIPKNQLVLVTGTSGTGKTIMCTQFIYNGVTMFKENGVYLSFEEPDYYLKENVKSFGWDLDKLEKAGKFSFIKYDPYNVEDVLNILESTIKEIGAKRIAIDSISALGLYVRDKAELRRLIFNVAMILRRLECTSMLVSEIVYGSKGISRYGVEEFVSDAVIVMYYERFQSSFLRAMQLWKLRGSQHSEKLHPYKIDENGMTVLSDQEAFIV
ncbi:MAG: AAA family ATPase [Candidatus Aenigmarchaeota archaeon]|nr:AAA family ATPase [Candidatus Aenigmarchaeota archaeon]